MAKTIHNPTDNEVRIVLDGIEYRVPAKEVVNVADDAHAATWLDTHQFLRVVGADEVVEVEKEPTVDDVLDTVQDTPDAPQGDQGGQPQDDPNTQEGTPNESDTVTQQ